MTKSNICVVTTTRAEFGLLHNFVKRLSEDDFFDVTLLVSGTHLMKDFGYTISEIYDSNINCKIEKLRIMSKKKETPNQILANTVKIFGKYFRKNKFDCVVVLGDRYEILGVAEACLLELIPVVHISGGDLTFGAVDDACRHAITKLSNLHFTGNEAMRNRVIQMGEQPDFVFNVGEPGVENVLNQEFMTFSQLKESINFENLEEKNYFVVTYHPETISNILPLEQIKNLLQFISKHKEYQYIITKSNIDNGGVEINQAIKDFAKDKNNIIFIDSLGFVRYLSSVKYSKGVIGNSSSGIIEVPYFRVPTINIGNRQEGRLQPGSIINSTIEIQSLENALKLSNDEKFIKKCKNNEYLYGDGKTSEKMHKILKEFIIKNKLNKKKIFFEKG